MFSQSDLIQAQLRQAITLHRAHRLAEAETLYNGREDLNKAPMPEDARTGEIRYAG